MNKIDEKNLIRGNLVRFRYISKGFRYITSREMISIVVGYIDKITRDSIYVGNECGTEINGAAIYRTRKYKKSKIRGLESKLSP